MDIQCPLPVTITPQAAFSFLTLKGTLYVRQTLVSRVPELRIGVLTSGYARDHDVNKP